MLRKRLAIGACGTARPNSKDFPKELAISKKAVGQLPYHFRAGIIVRDVGVLLWFDNAPVTIMTTIHSLIGEKSEISRKRKRPGRKSTNARRALAEFGEDHEKELQIPVAINDYNFHMGGVDIADQYRSYYDTQLTTFRTWFPIFFWALDTALINSYIAFSDSKAIAHKEFRLEVAWDLILEGERDGKEEDRTPKTRQPVTLHPVKQVQYIGKKSVLPPGRGAGAHLPEVVSSKEECWLCRYRLKQAGGEGPEGRGYKTHWHCTKCQLPLCIQTTRNCFKEFHTMD